MKLKIVVGLAALVAAHGAFATRPCPPEMRDCGPNPYHSLAVGFTQVCSELHPENAAAYKSMLAAMVARYPAVYARMEADPEFRQELQVVLKELHATSAAELDKECTGMLADAQAASQLPEPGK